MIITEIIEKKRDGQVLKPEEIDFMINGLVNGEVADYQMTSFMMAVCCRGMNETETAALTKAMIDSGNTIDLSDVPGIKVDKHSTGGVGDTTTLVVAPLVAACGGTVAKMSGRGLAHSGGTLDKLESVPGVCVEQPLERFKQIVRDIGLCVIGQSADLDPADKRMYALRDVSGTVKSIPLIASSIMSKKLASGTDAIVLDVKTGNGAFMEKIEEAVVKIITENQNNDRETGLGEVGSRLVKLYPDFDVRRYGYSLLSKFLESLPKLMLMQEGTKVTVTIYEDKSRKEMLEEYILLQIQSAGSYGIPLSSLGNRIRMRFGDFKVRDYGFSQFKQYIASFPDVEFVDDEERTRAVYMEE